MKALLLVSALLAFGATAWADPSSSYTDVTPPSKALRVEGAVGSDGQGVNVGGAIETAGTQGYLRGALGLQDGAITGELTGFAQGTAGYPNSLGGSVAATRDLFHAGLVQGFAIGGNNNELFNFLALYWQAGYFSTRGDDATPKAAGVAVGARIQGEGALAPSVGVGGKLGFDLLLNTGQNADSAPHLGTTFLAGAWISLYPLLHKFPLYLRPQIEMERTAIQGRGATGASAEFTRLNVQAEGAVGINF